MPTIFFKLLDKMTLRGKGKIGCDLNQAVITELQQILCLFNLFFSRI